MGDSRNLSLGIEVVVQTVWTEIEKNFQKLNEWLFFCEVAFVTMLQSHMKISEYLRRASCPKDFSRSQSTSVICGYLQKSVHDVSQRKLSHSQVLHDKEYL